jgi:hypothetical protein
MSAAPTGEPPQRNGRPMMLRTIAGAFDKSAAFVCCALVTALLGWIEWRALNREDAEATPFVAASKHGLQ